VQPTHPSTSTGPIIVGVDGSDEAHAALAWAVDNSVDDQPIHVVHAFSPVAELALAAVQQDWTSERQHRARELDKRWVAEASDRGVVPHTSIVDDDPAHALLAKAQSCHGSMIVVGPHGAGRRRSLGRVTRALLHELSIPVVIARKPVGLGESAPAKVLVGVGYGNAVDAAISWAAEYAWRGGFVLELFHVVGYRPIVPLDSPSDMLASYLGGSTPVEWASSELDARAEAIRQQYPDLDVTSWIERGSVVHRTLTRSENAAVLVLGQSHVERATRNLYSSRTLGIISQASTTVVVVPT
jgi:nucleotide-binding universal stress UspA family protein